ncbi:MAG: 50S ribosomal protein L21 [Candidatus Zambryskibacteria bacterium]|nr:50S ribosomal protein L21 [Candidatus Zambryskibacteria bacterium]
MTEVTTTPKKTLEKAPKAKKTTTTKAIKDLFAVIATGGKQYRVSVGDTLKIEKLSDTLKEGDSISFNSVLMLDNGASDVTLGTPFIKDSVVTGTLRKIARYKTVDVIKYKQKSRYFKKYGHRQPYFEVQIDSIK